MNVTVALLVAEDTELHRPSLRGCAFPRGWGRRRRTVPGPRAIRCSTIRRA